MKTLLLLLIPALPGLRVRDCGGSPPEPLHPRDYASASGDWVMHVDPSERYGAGPARYRMTRRGRVLWEYEQTFTFREAFVTSDGNSVGYAYTKGLGWLGSEPGNELVFALLGNDGTVLAEERTAFVGFGPPLHPLVYRFIPCPEVGKVVLEVSERPPLRGFQWWVYSLANGAALEKRGAPPVFLPSLDRAPSIPEALSKELALDELPRMELTPLGSVTFEEPRTIGRLPELVFELVDPFERSWFVDRETGDLWAFDRRGKAELTVRPGEDDLGRSFTKRIPRWMAVRGDGSLLVREYSGLVEFTPHGRRVGRTGEEAYSAPQILFRPFRLERWEVDPWKGRVTRFDERGEIARTIERGAHDRWLRYLRNPVVAQNGNLALLDCAYAGPTYDLWLHMFDPDGLPLGSLALPSLSCWSLAFDGLRVALLRKNDLLFVALDGTIRGQATLTEHEPYSIAFTPDGELWVFEDMTIHRYRVQ